jgi:hypothetical protein
VLVQAVSFCLDEKEEHHLLLTSPYPFVYVLASNVSSGTPKIQSLSGAPPLRPRVSQDAITDYIPIQKEGDKRNGIKT